MVKDVRNVANITNDSTATVDGYEFEPHYGVSRNSVRDALKEVLDDMVSHKSIHDWDRKLDITPFELLKAAVQTYLRQNESLSLNSLLSRTTVEEIVSIAGAHHRQPAIQQGDNIDGYLLFTKVCLQCQNSESASSACADLSTTPSSATMRRNESIKVLQGRVVFIEEQIVFMERAVLLILFSLYVRLQNEDYTFIHAFIERHLSLRSTFMLPRNWQLMSTPHGDSSRQKFYKRVTLSCHLVYLTSKSNSNSDADAAIIDRYSLFQLRQQSSQTPILKIFKASTSVLLTIVVPEESALRQEEMNLLSNPRGLWTVLVINCPLRLASKTVHEPSMHLTPVAQYVRGIACSVNTLRMNAEEIYDHLKDRLDASENGSLFDDENFTKSESYHWTIKTCDTLRETLASSQRYLERALTKQIKKLCEDVQQTERNGVETWKTRLEEEIYLLEELESQVVALNAQVQESVSLHGVTAVLEARIALQQGHRLKILAYLATIYLPLTASASLYSMAVLPRSATLWSFFVVLILLLLFTVLLGLSFKSLLAKMRTVIWTKSRTTTQTTHWLQILSNIANIILRCTCAPFTALIALPIFEKYVTMLTPSQIYPFTWTTVFTKPTDYPEEMGVNIRGFLYWTYILFRYWPGRLVHHALTRELLFVRDQYRLFFLLGNGVYWYPLGLVRDVFRLFMLPVWLVLVIMIVGMIIVQDTVLGLLCGIILAIFRLGLDCSI
ncbi:hypothetical protein GQ44DRAFT_608184 [Phaeosphaeriaceae sp. PMI808]|nr:hypothetical protein GQ44DRAFT_608184 [Phaeosphaeriaceae sp. PMI808]